MDKEQKEVKNTIYIEVGSDNYKVKIQEKPFCYIIVKQKIVKNQLTEKDIGFYSNIRQLTNALSKCLTLESLENKYTKKRNEESKDIIITLRDYLDTLKEREETIYKAIGKNQ